MAARAIIGHARGTRENLVFCDYVRKFLDTPLYHTKYDDPTILVRNLETELERLHSWFTLNKLTPNKKKCETIFFGNSHQLKNVKIVVKVCWPRL